MVAKIFDLFIILFAGLAVIIYSYILYMKDQDPWWDEGDLCDLSMMCAVALDVTVLIKVFVVPLFSQI